MAIQITRGGQTVQLLQLDGKIPNIALMRLAAHHKALGNTVVYRRADSVASVHPFRFEPDDTIYASMIFDRTRPLAEELLRGRPDAVIGGTGWNVSTTLESIGVTTPDQNYEIYPRYENSIGFTQRGCRMKCSFCVVPKKEGNVKEAGGIYDIWRGDPWPRKLVLLDNDFFGQPHWKDRIKEIREGNFKVSFNQGINARCLTDEAAKAIASVLYYDDDFSRRCIYTAWDSRADEERLFTGLNRLVKYGVRPDHITVYMLCNYWEGETQADREYRRKRLRDFGARPFPMVYGERTPELMGFQRWVIRRGGLMCSWEDFVAANYRPEKVGLRVLA